MYKQVLCLIKIDTIINSARKRKLNKLLYKETKIKIIPSEAEKLQTETKKMYTTIANY